MTSMEVVFVVLNYLVLAPLIVVLVLIFREERAHIRRLKVLDRALHQPLMPVKAASASVAVPASRGEAAPVPPWLRPNYIAPDDYAGGGFDYTIQASEAARSWRILDQGGFAMVRNRYHRRQGGVFSVNRKIYLN